MCVSNREVVFSKILLMAIWGVISLYLLNVLEIEKNISNYVIAFFIQLAGIFLIEQLFKGKNNK